MLRQIAEFPPGRTLIEEAHAAMAHLERAYAEMIEAGERIASAIDDLERASWSERFDERQEFLNRHGGWEFGHRIDDVLFGLGFSETDFDRPLETFSGGQRNRVLLAELLLASPDLMLLDEPTNHLDVETIEWLEAYLVAAGGGDGHRQPRPLFPRPHRQESLGTPRRQIVGLPWRLHVVREVAGRTSEGRRSRRGQAAGADRALRRLRPPQQSGTTGEASQGPRKMIARIEAERVETIADVVGPRMGFGDATRTGDVALEAVDLGKEFPGNRLFSGFNLSIERGARLGFMGPNGAGKTTLLRILLGEETPTEGSVKTGHNLKIGYLDQNLQLLDVEQTPLEAVRPPWRFAEKPEPFRALLARFGIGADMIDQKIRTLSGGERTRVALARISAFEINVLALDEPTNHLDLWACESLESALAEFNGTILVVSHDRAFPQ